MNENEKYDNAEELLKQNIEYIKKIGCEDTQRFVKDL